jgi:hypothetical protein
LYITIKKNVMTIGKIARFNRVDRRLFHSFEADNISDALRSTIKHTTVMTLNSDTPIVENALITDDVALVVLKVLLRVLIMDDNILVHPPAYLIWNSNMPSDINSFSNVRPVGKVPPKAGLEAARAPLP